MVVSKLAFHGEALSTEIVCHVFAPAGLTWKVTETAAGPLVDAVSGTVPEMFAPGFVRTTVGAVELTWTVTGVVVLTLPALSVITRRRS